VHQPAEPGGRLLAPDLALEGVGDGVGPGTLADQAHEGDGLAREEGLLPGVKTVDKHVTARRQAASWSELVEGWRHATARLAVDFARGLAGVDPKRPFATCEHCGLSALCRVRERLGALAADEAPAEDGEEP